VVKPFTFEVLLARTRALLRRGGTADRAPVLTFGGLRLDTGSHEASRGRRRIQLTATELALLLEFLEHPRRVLPKEALLDRV
jgi:DNA-binding response OmpR family regulator